MEYIEYEPFASMWTHPQIDELNLYETYISSSTLVST